MIRSVRSTVRRFLSQGQGRRRIEPWMRRLFEIYYDMPFPPTHYYSPLPDVRAVKSNLRRWYKEDTAPGIDWNLQQQRELIERLMPYSSEMNSVPAFNQVTQDGYGPGYGEVEAHVLYMMLRHLKPSRIIEVGSGVSTFYTLTALRANRERDNLQSTLMCVEPYPNARLRALVAERQVDLRECEVQDVGCDVFGELASNDVLFIDSSHVSKKDSDVDFLFLDVMPRLRQGVVVHIHDITFPMPALPLDHALFDAYLFWNEGALVRAFLSFNAAFKILMCQSYLHYHKPDALKTLVPIYDSQRHFPASLWITKTA